MSVVVTGDEVTHDLAQHGRAAELGVLTHLARVAPELRVPRLVRADARRAVYTRVGTADLQRVLPAGPEGPPAPSAYEADDHAAVTGIEDVVDELGREFARLHAATPVTGELTADFAFRLCLADQDAREYTLRELRLAADRARDGGFLTAAGHAEVLRTEVPELPREELALVHFDPHPRNIRVDVRDGRASLAGLIDFKNTHFWLPHLDVVAVRWHLAGTPAADRFVRSYEDSRGRVLDPVLSRVAEIVRLVFVLANGARREPAWVRWCGRRLNAVLDVEGA